MAKKESAMGQGKHSRNRKGKSGPTAAQLRQDDSIMNTNDSSIVSKRCVSKLYFQHEPDFYEPFVQKFTRRSPLINRGYWLRMHAVEQVVHQFLQEDNKKSKVVVNLGCGYDPLPFQFWHRYESLSLNATFVDVDYPQLIGRKRDRMLTNSLLRDSLLKTSLRSAEMPVYVRSDKYMAIGCDLRDLETLERTLRAELDVPASSILFVAEVSLTYMPVSGSDSLIRWASTLEDTRFCLLEQYLPQGSDHPFAHTMLKHFDKLQTSIQAVKQYPSLTQQSSRFTNAGWPTLMVARNLWDMWSDEVFTPPALRRGLDAIEPFDEWEEFALFSGHYFLLVASNTKLKQCTETPTADKNESVEQRTSDLGPDAIALHSWKQGDDALLTPRRFGAAYSLGEGTVALHGGQGTQNRLSNVDILGRIDLLSRIQPCTTPLPHARICHTITPINKTDSLLVGGRGSPAQALADCWLSENGSWKQVDDLTPARFRHSSARLSIKSEGCNIEGVLVFGGKASDGTVLDEWTLWTAKNGWQKITVDGPRPSGRFSAAVSSVGFADGGGLIIGGVDADGTVLEEIWEWQVLASPHLQLKFHDRTKDLHSNNATSTYARIGASLVPFRNSLLLIGGVSRKEILSLTDDFLVITHSNRKLHIKKPAVRLPSTWPLLVGAAVSAVGPEEIMISGGGAVCFSMGSYWNEGYFTITLAETQGGTPWRMMANQRGYPVPNQAPMPKRNEMKKKGQAKKKKIVTPRTTHVPRIRLQSAEDFSQLVADSQPAIIEGLDIGPCTELWTVGYLREKIGAEREIVIHECRSERMTFKDKNFEYVKQTMGSFLDGISQGSKTYLRAVSSSQPNKHPTKLEDDFPTIAADFQLPDALRSIKDNYHSSPLRISGPVTLWLHYDVLANVLCQIRGTKTLHLYPPSDVKYLSYPPGGSSSNTDVLTSKDPQLQFTHPHIASLGPGDILFLPPMWSHTATPDEDMSVAVNVFWRNLENGYAAGKDVYGNRDLQAYENGRRDVERIVKAFKNVPADLSRFYLNRLTMELQEKADKLEKTDR